MTISNRIASAKSNLGRPDEVVLRLVFGGLIAATIYVLANDLYERHHMSARATETLLPGETPRIEPFLPSVRPDVSEPGKERRSAPDILRNEMTIELVDDHRLEATGTITPGTAKRFRAEVEKRGSYVRTVVLNSPGGSVQDALEMGKLIREKEFATLVPAGGHCASSCPLVFSGGVQRSAGKDAAIGVHQMIAYGSTAMNGADVQNSIQTVSAACQRHLTEMGVDLKVWMHAMETPPQELFYFTPKELRDLRLISAPEDKNVSEKAGPATKG